MLDGLVHRALTCFHKVAPDKLDPFVVKQQERERGDGASDQSRQSSVLDPDRMPDEEELESAFEMFVAELDLSADKEAAMYDQPAEKKWMMLVEQSMREDKVAIYQSCEFFMSVLVSLEQSPTNYESSLRHLEALSVTLRTQSHSYVQRFIKLGGLDAIVSVLHICQQLAGTGELAAASLGCFKALLHSTHGRMAVLQSADGLATAAACIGLSDPKCKILSLEILSGLCLMPDGHKKILQAISDASEALGERTRFQRITEDLWRPYRNEREAVRVKTTIMSLINALLKSGPAEHSLEFRLHLRYELLMLGMQEIVDRLRNELDNPTLHDHIDLFDMMRQEDEQEMTASMDSGASSPVDYENPAAMADVLTHRLADSVALPHLISLLQHLLMVPGGQKHLHLWRLFDMVLQQLSLQSSMGMVADTFEPVANVDMDEILSRLHTQSEFEKLEKSYLKLQADYDAERTRVLELERRLSDLRDKGIAINVPLSEGLLNSGERSLSSRLPPVRPPLLVPPPPPPPPSGALRSPSWNSPDGTSLSVFVNESPKKSVPKPSGALKTLNWTRLSREKIVGTVWETVDDEKLYKQLDLADLAVNFAAPAKGENVDVGDVGATLQRRLNRDTAITVIDPRRAQNCTILLSKLKLTNKEIRHAVLSMDERGLLPRDMLDQMLKFIPTKEEVSLLNEAVESSKSVRVLAAADRFLLEMSKIPRYEERMKCLHIIRTFRERVEDVKPPILAVTKSAHAVSTNKRLKQLLALVLAVGNFLNYGKRNGDAQGFTLSSLSVLIDVKNSLRCDRNLLHYLLDIIEQKFPDILRLKRELSAVYEAARCSRQEIHHELKALEVALDTVRKELELHKRRTSATSQRDSAIVLSDENDNQLEAAEAADAFPDIPGDRFIPVVTVFLDHATNDYAELDSVFSDMKQTFNTCVKDFGGDPLTSSPDEFFGDLTKFLNQVAEATHQIWNEREQIERVKRQTLARSIFAKKSKRKELGGRGRDFEQLISALQSGELFSEELSRLRSSYRSPSKKTKSTSSPKKRVSTTVRDR